MIAVTRKFMTGSKLARIVEQRDFVVTGLVFVVAMHVAFLFGTGARGPTYAAIQTAGLLASAGALWGVRQGGQNSRWALAGAFGALAFLRILQTLTGISRLTWTLQYALFGALVLATLAVALRWSATQAILWLVAFVFFAASVSALTGGSLPGLLGLTAGMIGFSLIAPNFTAATGPPVHADVK